jgi:hypothetical protein
VTRYRNDPDTDFHLLAATITQLERDAAKAVNFAKIYGAGVKKFAAMIGKPLQEAQRIYAQYDRSCHSYADSAASTAGAHATKASSSFTTAPAGISIASRRAANGKSMPALVHSKKRKRGSKIPTIPGIGADRSTVPMFTRH